MDTLVMAWGYVHFNKNMIHIRKVVVLNYLSNLTFLLTLRVDTQQAQVMEWE